MKFNKLSALVLLLAGPLVVLASPENDRKIEAAAKGSYNFRTVLENQVTVTAADGIVTLTGTVEDKDQKDLAEDTVQGLPGVTGVHNELTVKAAYPEHSDAWIAFKIHSTLLVKANVSAFHTKVAVDGGNVTLTGTADNLAQKELTEVYVREIDFVKSVKNDLVVVDQPPKGETVGESIDDASITTQVKYALLTHKATSALRTKVTTTEGVIAISGEAASDAEISLVTKLASDIRGVKSVNNTMTVKR